MNTATLHAAMDDMAEFGSHNFTLMAAPIPDRAAAVELTTIFPTEAASACTEIDADPRDVDLSHIFPLERAFRDHPGKTWFCVAVLFGLMAWAAQ